MVESESSQEIWSYKISNLFSVISSTDEFVLITMTYIL
jgi:hypothetical protein